MARVRVRARARVRVNLAQQSQRRAPESKTTWLG